MQNGVGTLFFALVGPNNNGHNYIAGLIQKGVQNFVVNSIPDNLNDKANFLVVENDWQMDQLKVEYGCTYVYH